MVDHEYYCKRIVELEALVAQRDKRIEDLLQAMIKLTREMPYHEEYAGWEKQRASLIAEVGTLKARVRALEEDLAEAEAAFKQLAAYQCELEEAYRKMRLRVIDRSLVGAICNCAHRKTPVCP